MTVFVILLVSILAGWGIARLFRNRCSVVVRAVIGILTGFTCLFVLFVAIAIWAIANYKPPKPFDAASYKGETGKISVPFDGKVTVSLWDMKEQSRRRLTVTGDHGVVVAPVGRYQALDYNLIAPDKNGRPTYVSAHYEGTRPMLEITSGSTAQLTGGPPLTAWIDVKQQGRDKVNMNFHLTGRSNESCSIRGEDGKGPGFQVLSKSGQVLMEGTFEYG